MTIYFTYGIIIEPRVLGKPLGLTNMLCIAYLQRVYGKGRCRNMYAIIETGGKQYQVNEGDEIFIEKLEVNEEDTVTFDKVIAVGKDSGLEVGAPYVGGASVQAKVLKNGKAKKITVFTYKPKKGSSHRKQGHRQPYTKVRIDAIKA